MVLVEGIAVSGEHVEKLEDKSFVVIKAPHYEKYGEAEEEKKVVMMIELLQDNSKLEYHPNKTSLKTMARLEGFEMDDWLGKKFRFEVVPMKVSGQDRKVLYVLDKKE